MNYLDFEEPIAELQKQLDNAKQLGEEGKVDVSATIKELEKKIKSKQQEIYGSLSGWQKVQLSRHPDRPYSLFYIEEICKSFLELHGDRTVKDDKAIIGGFGNIDGSTVMFIGHQKGINTKMRQYRNFGMANPEGYRKALRLMKLAEKFDKPVVTLIDTPGAYPGLEAEERGQAEAIAKNLYEMTILKVPIICIIIGEGASGGALGIGVGDKVLMLENTWYSVISPESCSSILWRSWEKKEEAAEALKLTSNYMFEFGLVDGIIKEPFGGAHTHPKEMARIIKRTLIKEIEELRKIGPAQRVTNRINKFSSMGVFSENGRLSKSSSTSLKTVQQEEKPAVKKSTTNKSAPSSKKK